MRNKPSIKDISNMVCMESGIPLQIIWSNKVDSAIVDARYAIVYIGSRYGYDNDTIGHEIGRVGQVVKRFKLMLKRGTYKIDRVFLTRCVNGLYYDGFSRCEEPACECHPIATYTMEENLRILDAKRSASRFMKMFGKGEVPVCDGRYYRHKRYLG